MYARRQLQALVRLLTHDARVTPRTDAGGDQDACAPSRPSSVQKYARRLGSAARRPQVLAPQTAQSNPATARRPPPTSSGAWRETPVDSCPSLSAKAPHE